MKEVNKISPERFHSIDNTMSIEKIFQAYETGDFLACKVIMWLSDLKCFKVDLGNGFTGYIPEEYASIYPTSTDNGFPTAYLRSIIGKIVVVSIIEISKFSNDLEIVLSRKDPMTKAVEVINNSIGKYMECCVSSFSNYGVFVDVCNGVSGLINYKNFSSARLNQFSDIGINVGDKISAKILSINSNSHVFLNYKEQFENLAFKLSRGDLIEAIVLNPVNQNGYFAYLNPNTFAAIDVPKTVSCKYGDKVIAIVKGVRNNHPDQLKLSFVSFS